MKLDYYSQQTNNLNKRYYFPWKTKGDNSCNLSHTR